MKLNKNQYYSSISSEDLDKYNWFNDPCDIGPTDTTKYVIMAREGLYGDGRNVWQISSGGFIVTDFRSDKQTTIIPRAFGPMEVLEKHCNDFRAFARRPLTELEKIFSNWVLAGCDISTIEQMGMGIAYPHHAGAKAGNNFLHLSSDEGIKLCGGNFANEKIVLTADADKQISDQRRKLKLEEREKAILGGGTAVVVSCKGMAKTRVPAGTLKEYGTFGEFILPDGTCYRRYSSGQGRSFGYGYEEKPFDVSRGLQKADFSQLDWDKYHVVEADESRDGVTQIFGCRHGAAQDLAELVHA